MALPNDKRSLQDRLSRVATRMAQKFGNGVFTGVTAGAGASAGIPVSVLINRIAGKKVSLDSLGREDPSALIFTVIDAALGTTAATQDQLVVQTYIPSQMPVGIYGSPAALAMLAKLKAGVDSVDFHLIGDSNIGNPSKTGLYEGICRGLIRGCCAEMYGGPILPVIVHPTSSTDKTIGTETTIANGFGYRLDNFFQYDKMLSNRSAVTGSGATLQSGNFYAPSDLKNFFKVDSGIVFKFGSALTADFAWLPNTGLTYTQNEKGQLYPWTGAGLQTEGSIDTRNSLTYRVVHSIIPGSHNASIVLTLEGLSTGYAVAGLPAGTTYHPSSGVNAASKIGYRVSGVAVSGATGITSSFLTWPADSTRRGVTICYSWTSLGNGYTTIQGPLAVYLESLHGNTKGWGVTPILNHSGATTGGISSVIDSTATGNGTRKTSAVKTIVQETRERQMQAGGSGNLIVLIYSGINETGTNGTGEVTGAAQYQPAIKNIITDYKTIWDELGYPENDLAFIVATTHPTFLTPGISGGVYDWNLDSIREQGKQYAQTSPDYSTISPYSNITFVNITELGANGITQGGLTVGNSFNGNQNFYRQDGEAGSHLIDGFTGGYAYISELLINRCLRYSTSY